MHRAKRSFAQAQVQTGQQISQISTDKPRSDDYGLYSLCIGSIYISKVLASETARALKRPEGSVYRCKLGHWHVKEAPCK